MTYRINRGRNILIGKNEPFAESWARILTDPTQLDLKEQSILKECDEVAQWQRERKRQEADEALKKETREALKSRLLAVTKSLEKDS